MVLVVDASKGIQTQTAECIVIGEVAADDMVVALNKIGGCVLAWAFGINSRQHWVLSHRLHQASAFSIALSLLRGSIADQFPEEKRERYCRKAHKLVAATLAATKFAGCAIVPVAARPVAVGVQADPSGSATAPIGVQQLIDVLLRRVQLRQATSINGTSSGGKGGAEDPFRFYIDHCFAIKGQGTVMTGVCTALMPVPAGLSCAILAILA
jgi:selenocysteine-specific elongation factor